MRKAMQIRARSAAKKAHVEAAPDYIESIIQDGYDRTIAYDQLCAGYSEKLEAVNRKKNGSSFDQLVLQKYTECREDVDYFIRVLEDENAGTVSLKPKGLVTGHAKRDARAGRTMERAKTVALGAWDKSYKAQQMKTPAGHAMALNAHLAADAAHDDAITQYQDLAAHPNTPDEHRSVYSSNAEQLKKEREIHQQAITHHTKRSG